MPRLTSESAARIAKAAGLGMPDAAALLQLADDEEQAEALASQFARTDPATTGTVDDDVYEQIRMRGGMR